MLDLDDTLARPSSDDGAPERSLAATSHALLEALRSRGLRVAVVADGGEAVRGEAERLGLAARADAVVLSADVAARQPEPAFFRAALGALEAAPAQALFVGARPADVRAAAELGMTTVRALWFRADDDPTGPAPHYEAFTQMDVLNVVDRLR